MLTNKETVKEKKWVVNSVDDEHSRDAISKISNTLGINRILSRLLYNRGYDTPEKAASFIRMENETLNNPFDMKDMIKGVERIRKAIKNREKITVYGDYDVDGVTSVCTLYLYLKSEGADINYYIPNRTGDGYGVSSSAIDVLKESGTSLIITVDTGVTAIEEVKYASSLGVDFIVTDHHECHGDLPEAVAVINPHRQDCSYPFKELAGVGVVFKLICAYEEHYNTPDRFSASLKIIKQYADLVAIGTIADVMPIKDENRIIVKYGLSMIENTERVGLAALIEASSNKSDSKKKDPRVRVYKKKKSNKITSGFIGFTIAPRINAAGRIRSASLAVELFLTNDAESAKLIAEQLCEANKERQAEENKIMQEAYDMIDSRGIDKDYVMVLDSDSWHHGVIGIVSSRITEKYSKPSILISFEGNSNDVSLDDVGKGSGRSIKGLNLVEALFHCSDLLVKFGGHELAAGLSVTRENLPKFKSKLNEYAKNNLAGKDLIPVLEADMEIDFSDINLPLAESLRLLEPYGVDNPIPVFVMKNVTVSDITGVSENKHSRIILTNGNTTLSAMFFSNSPDSLGIYNGDSVDLFFSIDINEWLDRKNVQLVLKDIKRSEGYINEEEYQRMRFEQIKSGDNYTPEEDVLPDRDDFVSVYKFIQNSLHNGTSTFSHKDLLSKLSSYYSSLKINYIKLKFIIMIFREMNIVVIDEIEDEVYNFTIHYSTNKKNLEKSYILKKLRAQQRDN